MKKSSINRPRAIHCSRDRSGKTLVIIVGAVIAMVFFFGVAVALLGPESIIPTTEKLPIRADESVKAKSIEVKRAFAGPAEQTPRAAGIDEEDRASIEKVIEKLRAAMDTHDGAAFGALVDGERLFQEVERLGVFPEMTRNERRSAIVGISRGVERTATANGLPIWKRLEIRRIIAGDRPGEAVAFFRTFDDTSTTLKMRVWLIQRDGVWRLYDWEDLDMGLRATSLMAAAAPAAMGGRNAPTWLPQVQRFSAVVALVAQGEFATAETHLDRMAAAGFPSEFESVRLMLLSVACVYQGKTERALEAVTAGLNMNPDMPAFHYVASVAHNLNDDYELALASAEKYMDLMGEDSAALVEAATAQLGLGHNDLALDATLAALKDDPQSGDALAMFAILAEPRHTDAFLSAFARKSEPQPSFDPIASQLLARQQYDLLEKLAIQYRAIAPADPLADYYQAQALASTNQHQQAIQLLEHAITLAPEEEKNFYRGALLDARIDIGEALEAYQSDADPMMAFLHIADRFTYDGQYDQLLELTTLHQQRFPSDPWLHYYQGDIAFASEQYADAANAYSRAIELAENDAYRDEFRPSLVAALFYDGRVGEAYALPGDRRDRAQHLGYLCRGAKDAQQLEALLTRFSADQPQDPLVPMLRAELQWLNGAYAEAASTLRAAAEPLSEDAALAGWFEDRYVRSMIRSDDFNGALQFAQKLTMRDDDAHYEVIVQAAAGRVAQTLEAMQQCEGSWMMPDRFYDDEDAGPALQSETFAAVRSKYPPRETTSETVLAE